MNMHIHYLLLAHTNPPQLKRLVERLSSEHNSFYIHIDKRVDIEPFHQVLSPGANVHYLPNNQRHASKWGGIEVVYATVDLLKEACASGKPGYCVLMSGQDYPLKTNEAINDFFNHAGGVDFVNHFPLPSPKWPNQGRDRLCQYKIDLSDRRGDYLFFPAVAERAFYTKENRVNLTRLFRSGRGMDALRLLRLRRFPSYVSPYGGSQWWAITTETAAKILAYIDLHSDYCAYHKYTLLPDEMFFQSIVMDIHKHSLDNVKQTLTYVDWERQGVPLPVTFTQSDFHELQALGRDVLFARKFDVNVDSRILDLIDEKLLYSSFCTSPQTHGASGQ